jgi:hypothetical protein
MAKGAKARFVVWTRNFLCKDIMLQDTRGICARRVFPAHWHIFKIVLVFELASVALVTVGREPVPTHLALVQLRKVALRLYRRRRRGIEIVLHFLPHSLKKIAVLNANV